MKYALPAICSKKSNDIFVRHLEQPRLLIPKTSYESSSAGLLLLRILSKSCPLAASQVVCSVILMAAQPSTDSPAGLPVDNPSKSYWLSEPSEMLLGHRTTKELPQAADVLIIGSGITGALAAHFVKEKAPNMNVTMLEAREACWGATGRVSLLFCSNV